MEKKIASVKEPGRETRESFPTESLAAKYCKLMTLTSHNTTDWHIEPAGDHFDAVGKFTN